MTQPVPQRRPDAGTWLKAFRLRTLPLAVSSILMGSFLAIRNGTYNWTVIIMAVVTTTLLQILSNLANDYGDSQKGTDNINRLGPLRTVQSGRITPLQMKKAIWLFAVLSLASGLFMLYVAFRDEFWLAAFFLLIGMLAIWAAIKYTVGKGAYGYAGFGDLFVLLFFGFAGVVGTFFLNTKQLDGLVVLPALSLGFLSMGVLNLNNTRDIENDRRSGKQTVASRLGYRGAKVYHVVLVAGAIATAILYAAITFSSWLNFLFLIPSVLLLKDLFGISKEPEPAKLDPYLKKLAISTFLFTLFFGAGIQF